MVVQSIPVIRQALPGDLNRLANLIHFDSYVHRHLDYRSPLDWVGSTPFPILEENDQLVAALACPPDPPHVAWIRLFAAAHYANIKRVWQPLWQAAFAELKSNPAVQVAAAIPLYNWFTKILIQENFSFSHDIMMLSHEQSTLPLNPNLASIRVRPMSLDDLDGVTRIDQQAFPPLWQISREYVELAYRQAAIATVADQEGKLVGYQISTATTVGGHLARLAIAPAEQGMGIGSSLLYDLLAQFKRRGAQIITVNTQQNNKPSLRLYTRAGFELTGEAYPVYQLVIQES